MEAKVSEKLRAYGLLRTNVLDNILKHIPKNIFEHSTGFHVIVVFCVCTVIISIFSTTRSLTLFSLHPLCMTIGTILFIAEGIVSYRNGLLLDMLSPIMQHNKKTKVSSVYNSSWQHRDNPPVFFICV